MKVDKLVKNVYETIMASGMICQGDSVVVGVSGGADSVCLLSVLKNLQMSMALQLTAVHIHHGLRGEAADRDRDFVTALCEDMQIPCVCFQADIRAMAREQHLSEEEAGRKYRYDCFEEVRQERQASKIAVAHHLSLIHILMAAVDFAKADAVRSQIPVLQQLRTDIYEVCEKTVG